jgi:hypothetical protein
LIWKEERQGQRMLYGNFVKWKVQITVYFLPQIGTATQFVEMLRGVEELE